MDKHTEGEPSPSTAEPVIPGTAEDTQEPEGQWIKLTDILSRGGRAMAWNRRVAVWFAANRLKPAELARRWGMSRQNFWKQTESEWAENDVNRRLKAAMGEKAPSRRESDS